MLCAYSEVEDNLPYAKTLGHAFAGARPNVAAVKTSQNDHTHAANVRRGTVHEDDRLMWKLSSKTPPSPSASYTWEGFTL